MLEFDKPANEKVRRRLREMLGRDLVACDEEKALIDLPPGASLEKIEELQRELAAQGVGSTAVIRKAGATAECEGKNFSAKPGGWSSEPES